MHAGDLAELPDDHDDGDAGQVADQDGRGQQVADETKPEQPAHDGEQADQHGQRGGQLRVPGLPAASGATTTAVMIAQVDSGPTDSWREEPMNAYTASDGMAAHRPATGGRPASTP